MRIQTVLWTIPFCCFLGTYVILDYMWRVPRITVPALIGTNITEALTRISPLGLNIRLADRIIEPTLPEGTIVSQSPPAGNSCRPGHTILVVVSRIPERPLTPHVIGLTIDRAIKELLDINIKSAVHQVYSPYPQSICIGQDPLGNTPLERKSVTIYTPSIEPRSILFPKFIGKELSEVQAFLEQHQITPQIVHEPPTRKHNHTSINNSLNDLLIVIDQRPLAGSIIRFDPSTPPIIQLQVQLQAAPHQMG